MTGGPERCLTCADDAVVARVVAVEGGEALVASDTGGAVARVALDLVADAHPGDLLLCHAGIALTRLSTDPGDDAARLSRPPDRGPEKHARPEEPTSRPATPDAAPRGPRVPTERPRSSVLPGARAGSRDLPDAGRTRGGTA